MATGHQLDMIWLQKLMMSPALCLFLFFYFALLLFELFPSSASPCHHAQHARSFQIRPLSPCCEDDVEDMHTNQMLPFARSCQSLESSCTFSPSSASLEEPYTLATTTFMSSSMEGLAKMAPLWP